MDGEFQPSSSPFKEQERTELRQILEERKTRRVLWYLLKLVITGLSIVVPILLAAVRLWQSMH